mgnify:CR=1 FL=1
MTLVSAAPYTFRHWLFESWVLIMSSQTPTVLSVSQLNGSVRELLEFNYGRIWLRGELSNVSAPSSGHLYFTLKDDQAQVRAAMFKGARTASKLQQPPQNGQQVLVRARVSLYAPRGDYQLLVEHLEDAGRGALQQAYEMLKARLAAEGLFSAERKRALPANPRGVAIVTSPSGAAVRDILQVLRRRAPGLPVTLIPVPVQGTEAPPAIVAGLALLKQLHAQDFQDANGQAVPPFDVVIVARGGGSLEDLWAFNDEAVVRALAEMPVPVVSGVGHEIDFTIADFVVDVRAPTPSAAAELVSPDQQQWREQVAVAHSRLLRAWLRERQRQQLALTTLQRRLRSPARQLQDQRQRLDELELRLTRQIQQIMGQRRERLQQRLSRLQARHPARQLPALKQLLDALAMRGQRGLQRQLQQQRQELMSLVQRVHSVSPLAVLARGYAIVSAEHGDVLRRASDVAIGQTIRARLGQGEIAATVTAIDLAGAAS